MPIGNVRKLSVLLTHNYYQQPGGEDGVFSAEADLLRQRGHDVAQYTEYNRSITGFRKFAVPFSSIWSDSSHARVLSLLREVRRDVAHFHNTFPLVSPSAYYACRQLDIPVVQTLHNYRILCPSALFFRAGQVCEACLGRAPWPSVLHACYRRSRTATAAVAAMLAIHRLLGTWQRMVDVYIALTEFARQKFIKGGLPAAKVVVKPNFVSPDPGTGRGMGGYILFAGRLSSEKGMRTLIAAWERLSGRVPLKILGGGPEARLVVEAVNRLSGLEWLGRRSLSEVYSLMGDATSLVFPSECYEGLPRTVVESFAKGTPVIASDIGAISELVDHGRTGLLFRPGDPDDLAEKVTWALGHPRELAAMRREARAEYEAKYTAERNYEMLMEIYERAIEVNAMRR